MTVLVACAAATEQPQAPNEHESYEARRAADEAKERQAREAQKRQEQERAKKREEDAAKEAETKAQAERFDKLKFEIGSACVYNDERGEQDWHEHLKRCEVSNLTSDQQNSCKQFCIKNAIVSRCAEEKDAAKCDEELKGEIREECKTDCTDFGLTDMSARLVIKTVALDVQVDEKCASKGLDAEVRANCANRDKIAPRYVPKHRPNSPVMRRVAILCRGSDLDGDQRQACTKWLLSGKLYATATTNKPVETKPEPAKVATTPRPTKPEPSTKMATKATAACTPTEESIASQNGVSCQHYKCVLACGTQKGFPGSCVDYATRLEECKAAYSLCESECPR